MVWQAAVRCGWLGSGSASQSRARFGGVCQGMVVQGGAGFGSVASHQGAERSAL